MKWIGNTQTVLGIFGLFISLVYGLSVIAFTKGIELLDNRLQWLLVVFIIGFPIMVLLVFSLFVWFGKVYGPKDFKDEKNFMMTLGKDKSRLGGADSESSINKKWSVTAEGKQTFSSEAEGLLNSPFLSLDEFLEYSSFAGLLSLKLACISSEKKKPIDFDRIDSKSEILSGEYAFGYIVASSSAGLFELEDLDPLIVLEVFPGFNSKLDKAIADFMENRMSNKVERKRVQREIDLLDTFVH